MRTTRERSSSVRQRWSKRAFGEFCSGALVIAGVSRRRVGNSSARVLTFNPDLVIDDGFAVADVKYKWTDKDWVRSDLYQTVAFAVEYRTNVAALVGFRRSDSGTQGAISVGEIRIDRIDWDASEHITPKDAAEQLGTESRCLAFGFPS